MKILIISLILLSFFSVISLASDIEMGGYYEPQITSAFLKGDSYILFSNKIRVDLSAERNDNLIFRANFDFITYHGKTSWNILDFIPGKIANSVNTVLQPAFIYEYRDTVFLDNAYAKLSFSAFDLTVGKQQVSFGTGYTWNPTDLFNFKNSFDPTYEQPGHNSLRLDITLSEKYNASAIYFPEDDWSVSGKLLRFEGNLSHFDYSLIYAEKQWTYVDFISLRDINEKRKLFGGDFVGELFGLGVWGECGYNDMELGNNFYEALIGLDYTLKSGFYWMAEYYYNGFAKKDYRQYDINDWSRYILMQSKSIGRDNLSIYSDYPLTDLIDLENSVIICLSDNSIVFVPSIRYNIDEDVDLTVILNKFFGKDGTSYFETQGSGATVRLRVYF